MPVFLTFKIEPHSVGRRDLRDVRVVVELERQTLADIAGEDKPGL